MADLKLKELPTITLHKAFTFIKACFPSVFGMILFNMEHQCVRICSVYTGDDKEARPKCYLKYVHKTENSISKEIFKSTEEFSDSYITVLSDKVNIY